MRFLALAEYVGGWSKDRSTQVGAVIVDPKNKVALSTGWNGFPRGCSDAVEARHARPAKYRWTEHAERNAIYNAARIGVGLEGATLYSSLHPCMDCARAIVQSGIERVVTRMPRTSLPIWEEDFRLASELFAETGVRLKFCDSPDGVVRVGA